MSRSEVSVFVAAVVSCKRRLAPQVAELPPAKENAPGMLGRGPGMLSLEGFYQILVSIDL